MTTHDTECGGLRSLPADLRFSFPPEDGNPTSLFRLLPRLLLSHRGQTVFFLRLAQSAERIWGPLADVVRYVATVLTGSVVSPKAQIAPGLCFVHPMGIVIGDGARLGRRVTVMHGVTIGASSEGWPEIGDEVFIGPGAKIIGNVKIGDHASIGANAVVVKDVPAGKFAAGIPARVLRDSHHAPAA
jgi:serine O-acetyltransferase